MKHIIIASSLFMLCTGANAATKCSVANLTRCLDSVCAINISTNPAARCQYCGTSNAGTPPVIKGLRNVSVGTSAKYNISEKELKKAPSDPAQRYIWATKQCIAKVSGCTTDDVTDAYDKLIEQSCTAAGISSKMTELQSELKKEKTSDQCQSAITSCIITEKRCTSDYRKCESDADFDKYFAECSIIDDASGCDAYTSEIKTLLTSARDNAIKNADKLLAQIVAKYQEARTKKLSDIQNGCKDNTIYEKCVNTVCQNNMPYKCGNDENVKISTEWANYEKVAAQDLCKFYKTACETLD